MKNPVTLTSIDEAWQEVERLLEPGWWLAGLYEDGMNVETDGRPPMHFTRWRATIRGPHDVDRSGFGPTPAGALADLVRRLAEGL